LPRFDLDLVEYLIEWCSGIKHETEAEIIEMDERYPELRKLTETELMPAAMVYSPLRPGEWLKRVFKAIFK
jgi:hypothetical protein